jgi:hypothetical protein
MTIKKPVKKSPPTPSEDTAGGVTIADRFKLDKPVEAPPSKGLVPAFIASLAGLFVSLILVYILCKHWDFLMPA